MRALGALLCLSHVAAYVPALRRARARTARAAEVLNGDEAALYALGSTVARQLANLDCLSACELDRVFAGAKDALLRTEPQCDVARHLQRGMELHDARLRAKAGMVATAGAQALDAAAAAPGAIRTESGLVYHELAAGDGARPSPADSVLLHYHGTLCNGGAGEEGVVFDSSVARGMPLEFELSAVIAGWQEALPMMRVGGKAQLTIPSDLAYGERGMGPVPAGATLNFAVELLEITTEGR